MSLGCRAQNATPAATTSLKEDFRRLVFADRQPSPLNPKQVAESTVGDVRVERVRFTPEAGYDAVALIHRPKAAGRYPTVIFQHFLGGTKDYIVFLPFYNMLAQRGFLVAAIDGRFRGERQNGKSLDAAMVESLRTGKGHPFLLDTTYDITRLIDYLQTRPDVDPNRIGMTGFSEGGIITWMTTAVDDRIRVAVPIIGVTTFNEAIQVPEGAAGQARLKLFEPVLREHAKDLGEKEINQKVLRSAWEKLVPGMLSRFDAPNVMPLIAPRPLLILSHELDELFPVEGARKAHTAVQARYRELKAEDRLEHRVSPGLKHSAFSFPEVTGMIDWMERWLKAPAK